MGMGTCRDWARDMLVRVGTSWGMDDVSDGSMDTFRACPRAHDAPVGTGNLGAAWPLTRGPGGTFRCPVAGRASRGRADRHGGSAGTERGGSAGTERGGRAGSEHGGQGASMAGRAGVSRVARWQLAGQPQCKEPGWVGGRAWCRGVGRLGGGRASSQVGGRSGGQEIWRVNSRVGNLAGGLCTPPACCAASPWLLYILFFMYLLGKGIKLLQKEIMSIRRSGLKARVTWETCF